MRELLTELLIQVRTAWRYRWHAMIVAWVIAIAGWTVIVILPDKYESSARVFVDTDSMLGPLLRGLTIQTNVSQRLALMTRTLLRRPNLEKVARETDLDIQAKTDTQKEKLLQKLQKEIKLKQVGRENLYTITYQHNNPRIAKAVVQSLLNIFVESTLGDSRKDSDSAQKFLEQQISEYESRLIEAENKLAEFKRKNIGMIPGQGGNIFQRMEASKGQYESTLLQMREAEYTRNELKRQLTEAENAVKQRDASAGTGTASPIDTRILALQTQLDTLLLKYTEAHPSVLEIKQKIAALEKQKKDAGTGTSDGIAVAPSATGMNLVDQLRLSLGKAEASLAAIRVRANEYRQQYEKLKKLVDVMPKVEAELTRLTRDYQINKKNYDALVSRRESAKISESADAVGDKVKFRVVDPPRTPVIPSGPPRALLSIAVLFASLFLGAGLAVVLSQIHPVIYDTRTLRKLTGLPVFGTVQRVWTPGLLFKRKLEIGAYAMVGAGLILLFVMVILLNTYGTNISFIQSMRSL